MTFYVVFDGEEIVGKYERSKTLEAPEEYTVEEVDSLDGYDVDEWWFDR